MYIDVGSDLVIWTVNWLHYLNYEAIPSISSIHHWFVQGTSLGHPTDGVNEFHVLFISLVFWGTSLYLTVFLTNGKIVFHMSILSLVCSENVFASDCQFTDDRTELHTLPPLYGLRCSCGFCMPIHTYDIRNRIEFRRHSMDYYATSRKQGIATSFKITHQKQRM